jgi:hypothetical protein
LNRQIPSGTAIALVIINDEDTEWNGFIDECQLRIIDKDKYISKRPPLILQTFSQNSNITQNFFANDPYLDAEIGDLFFSDIWPRMIINSAANNNFIFSSSTNTKQNQDKTDWTKRTNTKQYILRTNDMLLLNEKASKQTFEVELKSSDKGGQIVQTGTKKFRVYITGNNGESGENSNCLLINRISDLKKYLNINFN